MLGSSAVIIVITICITTSVALSTGGGKAALLLLSKRLNASEVWSSQSNISGRLFIRISTHILLDYLNPTKCGGIYKSTQVYVEKCRMKTTYKHISPNTQ